MSRAFYVVAITVVAVTLAFLWQWMVAPSQNVGVAPFRSSVASSGAAEVEGAVTQGTDVAGPSRAKDVVRTVARTETQQRRAIWDAPDIVSKVRWAQMNGNPDEKAWAAEIFRECYAFVDPPNEAIAADMKDLLEDQNEPPAMVKAKGQARQQLAERCAGVKLIPMQERSALVQELRQGAIALNEQSMSDHQRLTAAARKVGAGETRFSIAEANAINEALHGEDPLLRTMAFNVLMRAIDDKAPGGNSRREALLFALGEEITATPLSQFEALEGCVLGVGCPGVKDTWPVSQSGQAPPSAEKARLIQAYREAFAKRLPYAEILALR